MLRPPWRRSRRPNGKCPVNITAQIESPRQRSFPIFALAFRLERFQAKWRPVRVKKTRQIKNLELRFDSIETDKALDNAVESVALQAFADPCANGETGTWSRLLIQRRSVVHR